MNKKMLSERPIVSKSNPIISRTNLEAVAIIRMAVSQSDRLSEKEE